MFGSKKSEIEKVFERFGVSKGSSFLKYVCTYYEHSLELKNAGVEPSAFAANMVQYIKRTHGDSFLSEYSAFMREALKNAKLLTELDRAKDKYYDKTLCHDHREEAKASAPVAPATIVPVKKENPIREVQKPKTSDPHELGRNEARHISCEYEGRENMCPKECSSCAISIKTDGDVSLAMGHIDAAIELYLQAVEIEPRFAEAWCNLANAYGMNREYKESLAAFDKAVSIDPRYGKALFGKAITLKNLGREEEAIELARIVNEFYPGNSDVVNFLNGLNYRPEEPKQPVKKPVVVPPITPPKPATVSSTSTVPKSKPEEWYKHCTYSVSLWEINDSKPVKDVGSFANAADLKTGSFYTPLLKMENHSGISSPQQFTITCVVDGTLKNTWSIKELENGHIQSCWLGEKNDLSVALIGIHSAEFFVDNHSVCSFIWCLANPKNDWILHLSSSMTLVLYNGNNSKGKLGSSVALKEIGTGNYVTPIIVLKNTTDADTPPFTMNCTIDGETKLSWDNCVVKKGTTSTYKIGEGAATPFVSKGAHNIVYSIMGHTVGKFDWSID